MTQRAIIATHARHNCAYFWLRTFQNDTTLAGALCPVGVFFVSGREEVARRRSCVNQRDCMINES